MLKEILKFFKRDKSGISDEELRSSIKKNWSLLAEVLIIWWIISIPGIIFAIVYGVNLSSCLSKIVFIIYAIIHLLIIVIIIALEININNLNNQIIENYEAREQNKI